MNDSGHLLAAMPVPRAFFKLAAPAAAAHPASAQQRGAGSFPTRPAVSSSTYPNGGQQPYRPGTKSTVRPDDRTLPDRMTSPTESRSDRSRAVPNVDDNDTFIDIMSIFNRK